MTQQPIPSALFCGVLLFFGVAARLSAQELQPRAYIPTPVGMNFFSASYSNNSGGLLFDPALPVEDGNVKANIYALTFGQTLAVLGRTTQALAVIPYVEANLDGHFAGDQTHLYRSGVGDMVFRYAMNIHGAPAMSREKFAAYRQKTIVGASITVAAPTGQYDPVRLINIGANRWAFKPEIGVSRAITKWTVEGAAGIWLFTTNNKFQYNGASTRSQIPLGSMQLHLVRLLPRRMWLAGDATFFTGGRSQVNGNDRNDYIANQRFGATFGIALNHRQAIKVSFFDGVLTRIGADIRSIGVSYTVIWQKGS